MDVNKRLVEAQCDILDFAIRREARTARLYVSFAQKFADKSELWSSLAEDEKRHADILRSMRTLIEQGHILWKLGRLKEEVLVEEKKVVESIEALLSSESIDHANALKAAIRIENSLFDSRFYDIVNCDLPEFKKVADELRHEEGVHLDRLRTALKAGG